MNREWMDEATERMVEEAKHAQQHWTRMGEILEGWKNEIKNGLTEEQFRERKDEPDLQEFIQESDAFLSHLFLIHGASQMMLAEAWESPTIAPEVKAQVALRQVEMMTGDPFKVVGIADAGGGGMGFLLEREDVEVPDDVSELDGMDDGQ